MHLKRVASNKIHGSGVSDLSATGLVHEVYLELREQLVDVDHSAHFFRLAAKVMQALLVDMYRRETAAKRGGGWQRVTLGDVAGPEIKGASRAFEIARAIEDISETDPDSGQLLMLSMYCGLSRRQIADVLEKPESSVRGELKYAKLTLQQLLRDDDF